MGILHVADHPDVSAQAQRLEAVLREAGISVRRFAARETNHTRKYSAHRYTGFRIHLWSNRPLNGNTWIAFYRAKALLETKRADRPP